MIMSELNTPRSTDVFPTIIVDRHYGEILDDVDFDVEAIREYLRGLGVPDEEILSHTIHLRAESQKETENKSNEDGESVGDYAPKDRLVTIFNQANPEGLDVAFTVFADDVSRDKIPEKFKDFTKEDMNGTTLHELDHVGARYDTAFQKQIKAYHYTIERSRGIDSRSIIIESTRTLAASALAYAGISQVAEHVANDHLAGGLVGGTVSLAMMAGQILRQVKEYKRSTGPLSYDEYYHNPLEIRARAAEGKDIQLLSIKWKPNYLSLDNPS